ncbi:hypothetical protein ScalyP_jg8302 [Parmales sp. scaly parma]|nr:hypothetical protein ScalyP_jg8302 [Parmales sp. scaly parma]
MSGSTPQESNSADLGKLVTAVRAASSMSMLRERLQLALGVNINRAGHFGAAVGVCAAGNIIIRHHRAISSSLVDELSRSAKSGSSVLMCMLEGSLREGVLKSILAVVKKREEALEKLGGLEEVKNLLKSPISNDAKLRLELVVRALSVGPDGSQLVADDLVLRPVDAIGCYYVPGENSRTGLGLSDVSQRAAQSVGGDNAVVLEAFHLEAVEEAGELQDNRRAAWEMNGEWLGNEFGTFTLDDFAAILATKLMKADSNMSQTDALEKAVGGSYSNPRKRKRALDGEAKEKKNIENEKGKDQRRRQQSMTTLCPNCSEECGAATNRSKANRKFYNHLFVNEKCLVSDKVATTTWAKLVKDKVLDATQGNPN